MLYQPSKRSRDLRLKAKPNPRYDTFLSELGKLKSPFVKWRGIAFRAAPLEFSRLAKLLNGFGSLRIGGRWSAAGSFPAVNLSLTQEGAIDESGAAFSYYNFAAQDVKPKVIVGVRLGLEKVVDLRRLHSKKWLSLDELLGEDWRKINDSGYESESQALGRAIHAVGAEALITPSARVEGVENLVFFPESITRAATVEILGKEELERWLKRR
jgi:RES domain-containing protein